MDVFFFTFLKGAQTKAEKFLEKFLKIFQKYFENYFSFEEVENFTPSTKRGAPGEPNMSKNIQNILIFLND